MAVLKIQLEFRMNADGWSEINYISGSGPRASQAIGQTLVDARVKALVDQAVIHHVRITELTPGVPSFRFIPTGNQGAIHLTRDVGLVCTNIKTYGTAGHTRTMQFHGLPDSVHVYRLNGTQITGITPELDTYLTTLETLHYGIRYNRRRFNDVANVPVKNITVAAGVLTVTCDTTGLAIRQKVRISSAKGYKARQWNGVYKIGDLLAGPPTAFTCQTIRLIDPSATYVLSSATLRDASNAAFDVDVLSSHDNFEKNGSRRTGRPTDSPAGKQSIKR